MLISKNQFKQPPNAAGGQRLNPRLHLCSFLNLDLLDTCQRVRAQLRRRRPPDGGMGEGENACAGEQSVAATSSHVLEMLRISIPAAVCAARQPVRPNKQPAGSRRGEEEEERPHYCPLHPHSTFPPSHSTPLPNNTRSWGCGCLTCRGSEMPTPCWFTTLTLTHRHTDSHTRTQALWLFLEGKIVGCFVASFPLNVLCG